jgi:integrase
MKIIQMWLGHSSMKTTSDCYSHLEASAKERAGEVLSSILGMDQDRESEEE